MIKIRNFPQNISKYLFFELYEEFKNELVSDKVNMPSESLKIYCTLIRLHEYTGWFGSLLFTMHYILYSYFYFSLIFFVQKWFSYFSMNMELDISYTPHQKFSIHECKISSKNWWWKGTLHMWTLWSYKVYFLSYWQRKFLSLLLLKTTCPV